MEKAVEKGFFSVVYDGWLLFAELVGRLNTKLIVAVIYFMLVSIAWIFTSATHKVLLDRGFRVSGPSAWMNRDPKTNQATLEHLKHQFML